MKYVLDIDISFNGKTQKLLEWANETGYRWEKILLCEIVIRDWVIKSFIERT